MADLTIYVLATLFVFFVINFFKNKICGTKNYPNGPYGLPFLGHLPFFGRYPPITFYEWWKQYGDVFAVKLGSWDAVVVNGLTTIRAVTNHPNDAFSGRPKFLTQTTFTERNGEDTLSFGTFSPAYVKQQKMAAKALTLFTSGRPEVVEEVVSSEACLFVDRLLTKCGTIPSYVECDVQKLVARFMYQLLFGRGSDIEVKQHAKKMTEIDNKFNKFTGSGSAIDVMPWLKYIMPWKISVFRKIISMACDIQEEQVCKHYETFSRDDIRDVTDAILASDADDESDKERFVLSRSRLNRTLVELQGASFATTEKTLRWLLLYMTAYPDVQERVHKEIDEVIVNRNVSIDDKKKLPFIEAVFLEINRYVTLVPFAMPHFAITDAKIGDFDVDRGTVVILNIHSVHHDQKFWGDPECFRPDRFLNNDGTLDADKCSRVIPFGIGRRRCVGEALARMNIFLAFTTIFKRCDFIKPPGEKLDLTALPGLSYYPHDFRVLVKERR